MRALGCCTFVVLVLVAVAVAGILLTGHGHVLLDATWAGVRAFTAELLDGTWLGDLLGIGSAGDAPGVVSAEAT